MTRLGRASVIAAFSLLAWAASAHAECAWVLWTTSAVYDVKADRETWWPEKWRPERGFKDGGGWIWTSSAKKECEDTVMALVKMSSPTTGVDGKRTYEKYLCLPDTVDPREPKK